MSSTPLSSVCPYCEQAMHTSRMTCSGCGVAVEGQFPCTRLAALPAEHQRFIEMFVLAGGNLKLIAQQTGVSYPTVRSRLDKVIAELRDEIAKTGRVSGSILDGIDGLGPDQPQPDVAARLIKRI